MLGTLFTTFLRYICHFVSGYILWGSYAEWFFTQDGFPAWGAALVERLSPEMLGFVYSLVYNGMYMVPEIILTAMVSMLIARIPQVAARID